MSAAAPEVAAPLRWLTSRRLRVALWALVLVVAAAVAYRRLRPTPLPTLGRLPAFTLTSQHGAPYGLESLRGHVWVADFFFTSCPSMCPRMTRQMAEIQSRLREAGDAVRLVSFSVDPEIDTPQRLRDYAARYGAGERWVFLTGPTPEIKRVSEQGFRLAMGDAPSAANRAPEVDIVHGGYFILIDRDAQIRGYYRNDEEGLASIVRDANRLMSIGR